MTAGEDPAEPADAPLDPGPDKGPERRCIASGRSGPKATRVRFVVGPDGVIVPDIHERLPGRGIWVSAAREAVEKAAKKGLFARAARARVRVNPDLAEDVETALLAQGRQLLGLARRAGVLVVGFEGVTKELRAGNVAALVEAADGAGDGRRKILGLARHRPGLTLVGVYSSHDLYLALGLQNVVHAALKPGRPAQRFVAEMQRLAGFRPRVPANWEWP